MPSELCLVVREEQNSQRISLLSNSGPYRFGRSASCDYIIRLNDVAGHQFTLRYMEDGWYVEDPSNAFPTFLNGEQITIQKPYPLEPGSVISVCKLDNGRFEVSYEVESITQLAETGSHSRGEVVQMGGTDKPVLRTVDVRLKRRVLIGRSEDCTIMVNSDRVSRHHCEILYQDGVFMVNDLHSTNGTNVNGEMVRHAILGERATINVPTQVFAFENGILRYSARTVGIGVDLVDVTKTVEDRNTKKPLDITRHISMKIAPNSFVGLVGCSGCGKSTLLNCITGLSPCTSGKVCFDKVDTRINRHAFDAIVGNVPQKDILHENLTIWQSLMYMAQLRIAGDAPRADLEAAVKRAIAAVDLNGREQTMITNLSGGQKKRVSIAMELLANPRLLILDEPTSGLSPDLDRTLMELLRRLSRNNCTIVMVTHNMDNINLFDKIGFLGKGGRMCYYGDPEYLLPYFRAEMISDIFCELADEEKAENYRMQYYAGPEFNRISTEYPEALQEVKV